MIWLLDSLIAYSKPSLEQQSRNLAANRKVIKELAVKIQAEQDKQERENGLR